jgi:hypothetical protein
MELNLTAVAEQIDDKYMRSKPRIGIIIDFVLAAAFFLKYDEGHSFYNRSHVI